MTDRQPTPNRWSPEFLDSMRLVADPEADGLMHRLFEAGGLPALGRLQPFLDQWNSPLTPEIPDYLRDFFNRPVDYPEWVNPYQIGRAEDLFESYGPVTVVVLLLNSVPHFFTNPAGARSFFLAKIFSPESLKNRMKQVPRFVVNITRRGGLEERVSTWPPHDDRLPHPLTITKGRGILTVQKLRIAHASIRIRLKLKQEDPSKNWDLAKLGEPINQEDLAEALMHFCFTTIDGLRKIGIDQSREDEEATLNAWKTVGFLLGLQEDMQPGTIEEGRLLRDIIFERHSVSTPEAHALIKEMLGIVQGFLPWFYRQVPAGLMRYQLGPKVADMLGVPNPRFLLTLLIATRPLWEKNKAFAKIVKWVSPHLVRWLEINV